MNEADYNGLSAFSCGVKELDDFFLYEVKECVIHHYFAAYSVVTSDGDIVAAFTLANDALMIGSQTEKEDFINDLKYDTDEDVVDFLSHQTSYPSINIGHLAVSTPFQGKGIGTLIVDVVTETYAKHKHSGCQFITVDALNKSSVTKFYYKNLFSFQTISDASSSTRRMYRIL